METILHMRDCPMHALGHLKPSSAKPMAGSAEERGIFDGEVVINNVALPRQVIEELRRLGIALSWYNAGELRDAVEACAADGHLIDDPDGVHFRDKLKAGCDEELQENSVLSLYRNSRRRKKSKPHLQHKDARGTGHNTPGQEAESCGLLSWF